MTLNLLPILREGYCSDDHWDPDFCILAGKKCFWRLPNLHSRLNNYFSRKCSAEPSEKIFKDAIFSSVRFPTLNREKKKITQRFVGSRSAPSAQTSRAPSGGSARRWRTTATTTTTTTTMLRVHRQPSPLAFASCGCCCGKTTLCRSDDRCVLCV